MRIILLLALLSVSRFMSAQEHLLTLQDIEMRESKVITAFEKFWKKPKKKRLKEKLISKYGKSIARHNSRLNALSQLSQLEHKNWEGIVNSLKSLQYLTVLAKSSPTTAFIKTKDYASHIDSLSNLAIISLYDQGKKLLEKNESIYALGTAYAYLRRALQFDPNYKDTRQLIDLAIAKGTKNVYFEPVRYDNLGNYFEWSSDDSSESSDYIIKSLLNDIAVNNVGSRFVENKLNADRIVEIKWIAINMLPERNNKYAVKRSFNVKENGEEKTVHATVNYNERYKEVTGELNIRIKDVTTQAYLLIKNFSGITSFSKIEADYTGDKRALTNEDVIIINNTNDYNLFDPEGYELTTKMYSEAIHNQVLNHIGRLLNWNYPGNLN